VELLASALALGAADRAALLAAARPAGGDPAALSSADALVPLVGRERELALLVRFLAGERAPLGPAPVLLLAGEPGIGKTRLLQAAAQLAVSRGWRVLVGGCQRRGGQEPYAPLLEALSQHLQAVGPAQRRAALAGCGWLVRLLPELAEDLEPPRAGTLAPEHERRLIHAAVARFLANAAGPAGTLLVLDDLQWADADALDLLATLLRTGTALRVVGAYRDNEVPPDAPLSVTLADLAQARLVRHHALGPLAPEEAAALLDDLLVDLAEGDRGQAEGVLRRGGGIPFFLISYAQALHQGSVAAVPWDLAQGVRQRAALLPAAGQELLGVAAVVGRRAARALLVAVAGQPEEAVLAGLEAACRARLLLEEGDDAYAFAHDVIQEVVEADVGAARRAVLHRKVAQALEGDQAEASPETLAYHYDCGGMPDQAVRYLEQAGDHAWAQRAHAAAESQYREALDRLERLGRLRDALRVREKLGEVLKRTGRYNAALKALEPAAETYRAAGDLDGLGRVTASVGEAHALGGTAEEGMARLRPLLEQLDRDETSPARAPLSLWLGVLLFMVGRYDESLTALERAAQLARAGDDERTLVPAAWHRANLLQMLGRLEEALRADREVLPLAERVGNLECLVAVPRDMAYIHALRGAFTAGRDHIDRSLALAEQMENPAQISLILAMSGWLAVLSGDWQRARADLERAQSVSRQVDRSWHSTYLPIFLARLSLGEGDWVAAAELVQEAIALAEGSSDLQALRLASTTMAEIEILEDRPEVARARLVPLLDRPGLEECDVTTLLPVLAWAYLEQGRLEEAAATVEQALTRARPEGMRLVLVEALRVQALIALRRERWDEAASSLEEGLTLARAMPYPYAEARLLRVDGLLQGHRGEPGAAQARLEAALSLCQRLGARTEAAEVQRDLSTLGGGRSGAPTTGQFERPRLTPAAPAMARLQRADRQRWALKSLRTGDPLSPRAYAAAMGVSGDMAQRDLQELVDRGLLRAVGTTRNRRYELADDPVGCTIRRSGP